MDSPQYRTINRQQRYKFNCSFKPYYKWIVLNTLNQIADVNFGIQVLNLIING